MRNKFFSFCVLNKPNKDLVTKMSSGRRKDNTRQRPPPGLVRFHFLSPTHLKIRPIYNILILRFLLNPFRKVKK